MVTVGQVSCHFIQSFYDEVVDRGGISLEDPLEEVP